MTTSLIVDRELIRKYGGRGPRYTSYPTADRFIEAFNGDAYRRCLKNRTIGGLGRPLALYVHHPFCDTICYYCACNKVVTRNKDKADAYLDRLRAEMRLVAGTLDGDRQVRAMHWGGGTPTFIGTEKMAALMQSIRAEFQLHTEGEYAIEIDPRKLTPEMLPALAEMGFNRTSFGVQDFNPAVQRAINRVQSYEQTWSALNAARRAGFRSVNFDLIYGLPKQTVDGFERTLDQVVECSPDRIALYSYAHLPDMFKPQRRIHDADMPTGETKLQLLLTAIERLSASGYVYIGMDHFAKPGDELAVAQRQGRLQRDFQGYSTSDWDTVGLGLSAISSVGPAYGQNHKTLDQYYASIDAGILPVVRGMELNSDDLLRRAVIRSLACQFMVSKEAFSTHYLVDFDRYFASEAEDLRVLEDDGLIETDREWIHVTPEGRLLVRSICMVFDRYLRLQEQRMRYSRVM
jgi:oxygen-independent coproporphyrinogen-3 oxidase